MRRSLFAAITVAGSATIMAATGAAALTLSTTDDSDALAAAALAGTSNLTVTGPTSLMGDPLQQGTFTDFSLTSPEGSPRTLADGIVLTTATANFSTTSNPSPSGWGDSTQGAFQPLVDLAAANNLATVQSGANALTFTFTADNAAAGGVSGEFIFGTDEFPTESVTDIVGIFVNGTNYAVFPNGDLVSNQSGDPNNFFTAGYGIEPNGLTEAFSFQAPITSGENEITIAVSNTSDTLFDSALFFSGLSAIDEATNGGGIVEPPVQPMPPGVIPLPAAAWLLLGGLGLIGYVGRRRD